ncbi:hypothetical protein ACOSP7_028622 [Xanthoceras sorbifolium]
MDLRQEHEKKKEIKSPAIKINLHSWKESDLQQWRSMGLRRWRPSLHRGRSKHLKELDCEEENDGQEEETTGLKISAMNSVKALPKSRGGMVPALLCRRPPLVGSRPMGCREAWYKVLV